MFFGICSHNFERFFVTVRRGLEAFPCGDTEVPKLPLGLVGTRLEPDYNHLSSRSVLGILVYCYCCSGYLVWYVPGTHFHSSALSFTYEYIIIIKIKIHSSC